MFNNTYEIELWSVNDKNSTSEDWKYKTGNLSHAIQQNFVLILKAFKATFYSSSQLITFVNDE